MYCPNCGSNNQAEIKFCTRCGTNLGVVSEALSGKPATQMPFDERKVKLLKDYYIGRRATLLGGVTLPIGLALLMAMFMIGFPEKLTILALLGLGLTIYGAIIGIWGIGHWMETSSEMKALGLSALQIEQSSPVTTLLSRPEQDAPVTIAAGQYSTDPINPGSVIEHTTRQLEEHAHQLNSESRPKQTSQ
jgi:hypothetical protein